jgi:hypothetical protein
MNLDGKDTPSFTMDLYQASLKKFLHFLERCGSEHEFQRVGWPYVFAAAGHFAPSPHGIRRHDLAGLHSEA